MSDPLADAAKALGIKCGERNANIVKEAIVGVKIARSILIGYPKGDPLILNLCPDPMVGAIGEEPAPMFVLDEIAHVVGSNGSGDDDVLSIYEESYKKAFWDTLIQASKDILDGHQERG